MKAWAGLGYYSRARNLKACADLVATRPAAAFPTPRTGLRDLPGIGAYTAAAIAAIAFDRPAAVVDGNVERVMSRLFEIRTPLPRRQARNPRAASKSWFPQTRPGDFAQAMMDLGATICTPKRPRCMLCPVREDCRAILSGDPELLPGPRREGREAAAARRGLRRRARRRRDPAAQAAGQGPARRHDRGADHRLDRADRRRQRRVSGAPFPADWRRAGQHHACLHAFRARARSLSRRGRTAIAAPPGHCWSPAADIAGEALPTVMKKAIEAAIPGATKKRKHH